MGEIKLIEGKSYTTETLENMGMKLVAFDRDDMVEFYQGDSNVYKFSMESDSLKYVEDVGFCYR